MARRSAERPLPEGKRKSEEGRWMKCPGESATAHLARPASGRAGATAPERGRLACVLSPLSPFGTALPCPRAGRAKRLGARLLFPSLPAQCLALRRGGAWREVLPPAGEGGVRRPPQAGRRMRERAGRLRETWALPHLSQATAELGTSHAARASGSSRAGGGTALTLVRVYSAAG